MNILKSIIKYIFSKFLYLIIIVGLPAVVAGICITGNGMMDLMLHFDTYEFTSFVDVYMAVLSRKPQWLYFQPLAFITMSLGLSLLYATIDSHMRMGEFSIRNVVRKLDYNFIPSLKYMFAMEVSGHLLVLLLSSLIFLYYKVAQNTMVAWSLTIVTILICCFIFLVITTWLILWLPTMLHTGANDNRAFVMASKQLGGPVFFKVLGGLLIPVAFYVVCLAINCSLELGVPAIFDILFFAFGSIWLVVTMNTWYYNLNNIERADLNSIWSKKMRS